MDLTKVAFRVEAASKLWIVFQRVDNHETAESDHSH